MTFYYNSNWTTPVLADGNHVAYTAVDLSSVIGSSGTFLVVLIAKMTSVTGAGGAVGIANAKPFGDADSYYHGLGRSAGISCVAQRVGDENLIMTLTDDQSRIEVQNKIATGSGEVPKSEFYLLGWCEWLAVSQNVFPAGAVPVAWTNIDLSAHLGNDGETLAFLKFVISNAVQDIYAVRKNGESIEVAAGTGPYGPSQHASAAANTTTAFLCPTDANQIIQHRQKAAGTAAGKLDLLGKIPDWQPGGGIVHGPAVFPGPASTWVDLDLGPWVFPGRFLAVLRVTRAGTAGTQYVDFRPKDVPINVGVHAVNRHKGCAGASLYGTVDLGYYVIVPTDENGIIEWYCSDNATNYTLYLEGYILPVVEPPTIIWPHPVEGYSPEPSQIRFSIQCVNRLDPATISISAVETGTGDRIVHQAMVLGAVQLGWDVTLSYDGATPERIDVAIRDWPMDLGATYRRIEMIVEATSLAGVSM